jgi:hypothetical protein
MDPLRGRVTVIQQQGEHRKGLTQRLPGAFVANKGYDGSSACYVPSHLEGRVTRRPGSLIGDPIRGTHST